MEKTIVKNSFYKSSGYGFLSLLVGTSFVWIGYHYLRPEITSSEKDFLYWAATIFLWFSVLLFWLLTIVMIWGAYYFFRSAFDSTPQIIFDEEGIFSKTFKTGKVFWREIEEVSLVDKDTIRLKLNNENNYLSEIQPSRISKKLPHLSFNLSFLLTDMNSFQAMETFESYLKRYNDSRKDPISH